MIAIISRQHHRFVKCHVCMKFLDDIPKIQIQKSRARHLYVDIDAGLGASQGAVCILVHPRL